MKQLAFGIFGLAFLLGAAANGACAQDAIISDVPAAPSGAVEQPLVPRQTYEEFQYESLERRARRSRNALIGTSAVLAVGTVLAFSFAAQCIEYDVPQSSEVRCSTPGYEAGLNIGAIMFTGGLIGTLTTGIMLGVRKGKMRRLDDQIAFRKARAVRWDPARSRFVF